MYIHTVNTHANTWLVYIYIYVYHIYVYLYIHLGWAWMLMTVFLVIQWIYRIFTQLGDLRGKRRWKVYNQKHTWMTGKDRKLLIFNGNLPGKLRINCFHAVWGSTCTSFLDQEPFQGTPSGNGSFGGVHDPIILKGSHQWVEAYPYSSAFKIATFIVDSHVI